MIAKKSARGHMLKNDFDPIDAGTFVNKLSHGGGAPL